MPRLPDGRTSRAVLIGTSTYAPTSGFENLPAVAGNLIAFERFLRERTGLENVSVVDDPAGPNSFRDALHRAAEDATDMLLFYFSGHGVALPDNDLGLTHTGSSADQPEWNTVPYKLVRQELRRSSAQVKIVILDCCHSSQAFGAGTLAGGEDNVALRDVAVVEGSYVLTATNRKTRFASARDVGGRTAFTGTLLDVLTSGIDSPERYLAMETVFPVVRTRLQAAGLPRPEASGRNTAAALALTSNAFRADGARRSARYAAFDTHWDPRARGVESRAVPGSYFTDRYQAVSDLVAWVTAKPDPADNVRIVGGGPGSGKSGVLAQLVTRSDPGFRDRHPLTADHQLSALPVAAIDGAVYARGLDSSQIVTVLAGALDSDAAEGDAMLTALAVHGRPVTFVVDGLDESSDPSTVAKELRELAGAAAAAGLGLRLLVGTRPGYERGLYRSLGVIAAERAMDLDRSRYSEKAGLAEYVRRRLTYDGVAPPPGQRDTPYRGKEPLAELVAGKVADRAYPSYLIAALTAAGLVARNEVVDTSKDGWDSFPSNVFDAMRTYLERFTPADRDRVTDLIRPLAYSHGEGLEPGPLWARLAGAAPRLPSRRYDSGDIDWLLDNAADYLLEVSIRSDPGRIRKAYRLYHQALVDYVKDDDRYRNADAEEPLYRALLASVPRDPAGRPDWTEINPYLRTHLVDHAAATGHLGELIEDTEFLLAADPDTLSARLRQDSGLDTPAARVYREATNFLTNPADRLFQLQLYAARLGERELGRRLAALSATTLPRFEWTHEPDHTTEYEGHSGGVWMVKTAELDGRPVIVSGSSDMTIRIWDLATSEPIGDPIVGHTGEVTALAVADSDDRPVIISGGTDTTIRIWDLATGEPLGPPLTGHTGAIMSLAVATRAGRPTIISAGADTAIRIWDLATAGQVGDPWTGHTSEVWSIDVIEVDNRSMVVSGGIDSSVRVWDLATGDLVAGPFTQQAGGIWTVAAATVGGRPVVVTGGPDSLLRMWDLTTGEPIGIPLAGHSFGVWHIAVTSLAGRPVAVSASMDMTLRVWDLTTGAPIGEPISGHTGEIWTVTCARLDDRPVAVSAGGDALVRVWDLATGASIGNPGPGHVQGIWRVAVTEFGGRPVAVSGGTDSAVRLWDVFGGNQIGDPLTGHDRGVWAVSASEVNGRPIAISAGGDSVIRLWDLTGGHQIGSALAGHDGGVWSVLLTELDYHPVAISAGADATIRIWDPATGNQIGDPLIGHTAGIESLTLGELDGRPVVVSGSLDCTIRVWDLASGNQIGAPLVGHTGGIWSVTTTEINRTPIVVSGSLDSTVRVWDLAGGNQIGAPLTGHIGGIWSVAITEINGEPAIVSGGDSTVRLWDPATATCIGVVRLDVAVLSLAASPANNEILIGHDAGLTAIRV